MRSLLRPSIVRQAATAAKATNPSTINTIPRRHFSVTPPRASGGAPEYDPPTGWLFGIRPGEKYEKEGWENMMLYGFCGSFAVFGIVYTFKPDTSIQTWALEEARRRLEAEGILEDPHPENK